MAQNGVGAVVEWLERWDHAATTDPDGEGREELGWQLAGQLTLELCPGKEEAGASKVFEKFLIIESNRNFFSLQKFIRQHNWSPKNCLSWGKNSVFPRLCAESEEYKG
jgi:hypothetical protein